MSSVVFMLRRYITFPFPEKRLEIGFFFLERQRETP